MMTVIFMLAAQAITPAESRQASMPVLPVSSSLPSQSLEAGREVAKPTKHFLCTTNTGLPANELARLFATRIDFVHGTGGSTNAAPHPTAGLGHPNDAVAADGFKAIKVEFALPATSETCLKKAHEQ